MAVRIKYQGVEFTLNTPRGRSIEALWNWTADDPTPDNRIFAQFLTDETIRFEQPLDTGIPMPSNAIAHRAVDILGAEILELDRISSIPADRNKIIP